MPGVELREGIGEGPGLDKSGFLGWVGVGHPDWEAGLIGLGRPGSMER